MKKSTILIFASLFIIFSMLLFSQIMSVSAAPEPWGIALNEQTKQCINYWGGDEFIYYSLAEGFKDYYPNYVGNKAIFNTSAGICEITRPNNTDFTECCSRLGYSVINCSMYYWFDNENKNCLQKQFCGLYMYYSLQTFESKEQCLKAMNESCVCTTDAKICPDGSAVGRVCPNCEFAPCKNKFCDEENNGICYKNLSNGRKAEIKIMPDTASEKAIERLGDLGFTVELKEVGKGDDVKVVYELTGNKHGKFLGIFKIIARVQAQVDAEDGNIKVIKPWWSFLASGV